MKEDAKSFKALWAFGYLLGTSYPFAIIKWSITDHFGFWQGLKELLWALFPVLNISYAWDYWVNTYIIVSVIWRWLLYFFTSGLT